MENVEIFKARELIKKGRTEDALEFLYELTKESRKLRELNDTLILRSNQLKDINSFFHKGMIRYDDYMIIKNNVINSFLFVCSELEEIESLYNRDSDGPNTIVQDKIERVAANEQGLLETNKYIFVFGKAGVGKTSMINSFANGIIGEYKEKRIYDNIAVTFPPRRSIGEVSIIDTSFHLMINDNLKPIPITFIDMAGEDLRRFDIQNTHEDTPIYLQKQLERLNRNNKYFLLVTSVDNARNDDALFHMLLGYLKDKKIDLSKIGIVISKWDMLQSNEQSKESIINFCREHLPMTTLKLNVEKVNINAFRYSSLPNNTHSNSQIIDWLISENSRL